MNDSRTPEARSISQEQLQHEVDYIRANTYCSPYSIKACFLPMNLPK